jgi:hypothetical protein
VPRRYSYFKSSDLAAAAEKVTVQQAAAGSKHVMFKSGWAYCSVICTVTLSRDGTAATTTAGTVVNASTNYPAAVATAFHTSNAGTGTAVAVYDLSAGGSVTLDLTGYEFGVGVGTAKNLSLAVASITGNVKILLIWEEE